MSEDVSPGAPESPKSLFAREAAPRFDEEVRLPRFNRAPRALEPVEVDSAYREVMRALEPLRTERDRLRERLAFLHNQVLLDPQTGEYKVPYRQVREYYLEMENSQQRLHELEAAYRQQFDPQVRPMLQQRLAAAATLPHYSWPQAEVDLGTGPAIALEDRVQYGLCEIDVDRIVATSGPAEFDWSGSRTSKVSEGSSSDIIIEHALTMLAGDYDPKKPSEVLKLKLRSQATAPMSIF